jgi:hypothetical protein
VSLSQSGASTTASGSACSSAASASEALMARMGLSPPRAMARFTAETRRDYGSGGG